VDLLEELDPVILTDDEDSEYEHDEGMTAYERIKLRH
jgi:hypothetical protein